MTRSLHRSTLATLVGFGLVTVVGCSSPLATGVVPPATSPAGETPTAAAPAAPAAEPGVPGAPPAAPAQAMSFDGTATFRGEPQAGLGLKAYDAFSGQELTVGGAPSSNGVALTALTAETAADGAFSLSVTGLGAGQAVTVTGTKGAATFSALVTGEGGYKVAQAGNRRLTLSEVSTALASLSSGVLKTFGLSGAKGSEAALKLAADINALNAKLVTAFKSNPDLANAVVAGAEANRRESGLNLLLDSIGGKQQVADIVGQAIMFAATANPAAVAALGERAIAFEGLGIKLNIGKAAALTLTNDRGQALDPKGGAEAVKTLTTRTSNGSNGSSVALSPLEILQASLQAALQRLEVATGAATVADAAWRPSDTALSAAQTAEAQAQVAYDAAELAEATASSNYQSAQMAYSMYMMSSMMCSMPMSVTACPDPSVGTTLAAQEAAAAAALSEAQLALSAAEAALTPAELALTQEATAYETAMAAALTSPAHAAYLLAEESRVAAEAEVIDLEMQISILNPRVIERD
jgi:hypothetical protein